MAVQSQSKTAIDLPSPQITERTAYGVSGLPVVALGLVLLLLVLCGDHSTVPVINSGSLY